MESVICACLERNILKKEKEINVKFRNTFRDFLKIIIIIWQKKKKSYC